MTDVPETVWVMPSNDGWLSPYCGITYYRGALAYRRADLPATDAQAMQNEKVKKLVEAAGHAAHSPAIKETAMGRRLRAALAAIDKAKGENT